MRERIYLLNDMAAGQGRVRAGRSNPAMKELCNPAPGGMAFAGPDSGRTAAPNHLPVLRILDLTRSDAAAIHKEDFSMHCILCVIKTKR